MTLTTSQEHAPSSVDTLKGSNEFNAVFLEFEKEWRQPAQTIQEVVERRAKYQILDDASLMPAIDEDEEYFDHDEEPIIPEVWTEAWIAKGLVGLGDEDRWAYGRRLAEANSVMAEGTLLNIIDASEALSSYREGDDLFIDYISALDSLYTKELDEGIVNPEAVIKADTHLSWRFGEGVMQLLASDQPANVQDAWSRLNAVLRSPVALKLGEHNILTDMLYNFGKEFHGENDVKQLLDQGDAADRAATVITLGEVVKFFEGSPHWGYYTATNTILGAIYALGEHDDVNPLVRLASRDALESFGEAQGDIYDGISRYGYFDATVEGTFGPLSLAESADRGGGFRLTPVASDASSILIGPAGRIFGFVEPNKEWKVSSGTLDEFAKDLSIKGYASGETFKKFCESFFLPQIRSALEQDLGISLHELSLRGQLSLAAYIARQNDCHEYDRLCAATAAISDMSQREDFAETFLSTEFGDDFGSILLDLADTYDSAELLPILEQINTIRRNGARVAAIFGSEFDMEKRGATAYIKRTTELLALAREEGPQAVADTLLELDSAVSEAADALEHDVFRVTEANAAYGTLQAQDHKVTLTARPFGQNARFGITVRRPGKERLSMRLDYEDGKLSMDIGSTGVVGTNASSIGQKVGRTLARGELALAKLRAEQAIAGGGEQRNMVLHGNHVREAFEDLPYMDPAEFAGIVNRALYRLSVLDSTSPEIAA